MKRGIFWILVFAFSTLNFSIFSQPPHPEGALPPAEILRQLNLTEEQQEKIEQLRNRIEKENIRLRGEMKIKRIELQEMIESNQVKEKDVFNKIEEIGELQKKILKNKISAILELKKILTKEQLKKIEELQREGRTKPKKKIFKRIGPFPLNRGENHPFQNSERWR